jgi:hypothetical protein
VPALLVHPGLSQADGVGIVKLAQIVRLTPSNFDDYHRCPRLFYNDAVLQVPASDESAGSQDHGLLVHDVLEGVHRNGSCGDAEHVARVLAEKNADTDPMRGYVERHARRCPQAVDKDAHEVDVVRLYRGSKPMFLATARIDAVWIHDGLLDARDYKTGMRPDHELRDDRRAQVQAWVLDAYAAARGLRLRLRYEYLAAQVDDDPDPWEPDADDIATVQDMLQATVAAMWADESWPGIAAPDVCGNCRYRSICRDSVARSEPSWPVLSVVGSDEQNVR